MDEDFVHITISDDGAGINPEKMKQVALKKGLYRPRTEYSDNQLINVGPRLQVAEKVRRRSGRGG
ncbi:MAG: hypothetical protein U5J62_05665 [Desulfurivibrio sp.]|nr:hypothetical protein [Desulfurivibrio sp.]